MATLNLSFPANPISAFSPYYAAISVTGTGSENFYAQPYDIVFNGITIRRYFDSSGLDKLPLRGILQSYFGDINYGLLPAFTSAIGDDYSKLFAYDKTIAFTAYPTTGSNITNSIDVDALFSVLNVGIPEPTTETIYQFSTLPLTVTQNKGVKSKVYYEGTSVEKVAYGKEILLSGISATCTKVEYLDGSNNILKTFNIVNCGLVPQDTVYVRWIDRYGTFKYYLLKLATQTESASKASEFNKETLYADPASTSLGSVQSRIQVKNRSLQRSFTAGVKAADDLLFEHLKSLNSSLKQWYWTGQQWIEIMLSDSSVQKSVMGGNPSVEFEFIYSPSYVQSL